MATSETTAQDLGTGKKRQRSIKNLLIDRRFQLKYTLLVAFLALAIAAVLGGLLYNEMRESSRNTLASISALKPAIDDAGFKVEEDRLAARDARTLLVVVACLGLLVIFILGLGIWMSHKIAGPIFIINRYLNEITEGRLARIRPLRKGDELRDFFESFQAMINAISERENSDIRVLGEVRASLRGGDAAALERAAKALAEVEERKKAFVGG